MDHVARIDAVLEFFFFLCHARSYLQSEGISDAAMKKAISILDTQEERDFVRAARLHGVDLRRLGTLRALSALEKMLRSPEPTSADVQFLQALKVGWRD